MTLELFAGSTSQPSQHRLGNNEFDDDKPLPPYSQIGQHEVDGRIASIMMKAMNDVLQTYSQAKQEGRYTPKFDIAGKTSLYDEAKDAMFEQICWVFALSSFDHVAFETCCRMAADEFYAEPETVRTLLSRVLTDEIKELVILVRDTKGLKKAQSIAARLSDYVVCPVSAQGVPA